MAVESTVPQLVYKKGGSYAAIAPKLKQGKFNKWKKRMLCYLAGMEPYYLKCIKDGPFQPKTAEGDDKPESQWTPDERRVVVQDQRLKSIIMSCLPDDIMESVISCETAKATWTDLVHSFEGPSDTKENRIMDLKLEYQTFRAKPTESLSQTYTRYKTLLNELANDGVNLSKHEINVGFVNSLPEKWLTFSQGLRNANHTQTLDLADIYGRFVYEDNLIQRRYSDTKKALITTPSSTAISTAFFSNNVVHDIHENSDDEVDERSSEEYLRDLDIEQAEPKIQKDYKAKYKKIKARLALLESSPSTSHNPKTFQPKNKGKNHARNGEGINITIRKVNILLSMDEDSDWQNYLKYINVDLKILVLERQVVNECLKPTEALNDPELSKDSKAESLTLLPPSISGTVIVSETEPTTPSVPTEVKNTEQE
ncbi:hypothetical protein Tco_1116635 [Tanacetum coccineum]